MYYIYLIPDNQKLLSGTSPRYQKCLSGTACVLYISSPRQPKITVWDQSQRPKPKDQKCVDIMYPGCVNIYYTECVNILHVSCVSRCVCVSFVSRCVKVCHVCQISLSCLGASGVSRCVKVYQVCQVCQICILHHSASGVSCVSDVRIQTQDS